MIKQWTALQIYLFLPPPPHVYNLLKISDKRTGLIACVECLSRAFVSMISSCWATSLRCSQRGLLQEGAVNHYCFA